MSTVYPSADKLRELLTLSSGNMIPVYAELPMDMLTPISAYLILAESKKCSFLFESANLNQKTSRFSFLGSDPLFVFKMSLDNPDGEPDAMAYVEKMFAGLKYVKLPTIPCFTGGAVGYVGYDCVKIFEPTTNRKQADSLKIPDAMLMFTDTMVIFDHLRLIVQVVAHVRTLKLPFESSAIDCSFETQYKKACGNIAQIVHALQTKSVLLPKQEKIDCVPSLDLEYLRPQYYSMIETLKRHIKQGDIIQAVPSCRVPRKTQLHPFNIYRQLRSINPSPYMFYMDLGEFQVVGASPELLVKAQDRVIYNHPIAGTRRRGATPEEDAMLARDLLADPKERAEHIMLVDLARNDLNRVCEPGSVKVDSLMHVEHFSHVMHIVSHLSGKLRADLAQYDAFRSVFPAGTLSGAPKVRALQLIFELEEEKRGIYGGAVGYFGYCGNVDTCIVLRTIVYKDGIAYLQAGGGIVYDSELEAEFDEICNKMRANVNAIRATEALYFSGSTR